MSWSPEQYARFRAARKKPFDDLVDLVQPLLGMRVLDLGCGTGELTAELQDRLDAGETLGVDSSPEMLAQSSRFTRPDLGFEQADIGSFETGAWDLVFSNAALHWLPDHDALFDRLSRFVAADGQLAVQVPANHDHIAHQLADEVAAEAPFVEALDGFQRRHSVEHPRWYESKLRELGFSERLVRLQVYPCELPSAADVVEWLRGSLLTAWQARLSPEMFERFVATYKARLLAVLPADRPFYYPYARILMWGRRA